MKFTCPAAYENVVRGAIARAMHDIVQDVHARVSGRPSKLEDFGPIDLSVRGTIEITITPASDDVAGVTREGVELVPEQPTRVIPLPIPMKVAS